MSGEYKIGVGIYEVRLYNSKDYLIGSQTFTLE